jgi:DNA-binding transcriptional LysR family regulator
LLRHACLRGRFSSGASPAWEFVRRGQAIELDVKGPLVVGLGGTADLAVEAAIAGAGVVYLFEEWLAPHFARGELEPVLAPWWPSFSGPFLYYAGRRQLPAPLRAFVDFVKVFDQGAPGEGPARRGAPAAMASRLPVGRKEPP